MNTSDKINEVIPALIEIQDKMVVEKSTDGVHSTKYAELSACYFIIKPILKEAGLIPMQTTVTVDNRITCTTRVYHSSGQWIESEITVVTAGNSPQVYGGGITYARRYGLLITLGISTPGEDQDAERVERAYNKAEEKENEAKELRKFQAAILPRLLKFDAEALQLAFEESGYASEEEDKEAMVCELIKQASSKPKLTTIGKRCKELQAEIDKSVE